jgi:hypothetical protein
VKGKKRKKEKKPNDKSKLKKVTTITLCKT